MPTALQRGLSALRSPRTALLLYAVLVLLPAAVFGALFWDELQSDYKRALEQAPREVRDATSRLGTEARRRVRVLLDAESRRSFAQYADSVLVVQEDGSIGDQASPLRAQDRPPGVDGWFQFDSAEGYEAQVQTFYGEQGIPTGLTPDAVSTWIHESIVDFASTRYPSHDKALDVILNREDPFWIQSAQQVSIDQARVAFFTHQGSRYRCAKDEVRDFVQERIGEPHRCLQAVSLHLVDGPTGEPTLLLLRDVLVQNFSSVSLAQANMPSCLDGLLGNQHWIQGLWLDPDWLFESMPQTVAETVLADRQRLFLQSPAVEPGDPWVEGEWSLLEDLTFVRREAPPELGRMVVAVNTAEIASRYRTQSLWFTGLASIMGISGLLGIRLLLSRIRLSSENARRSENFVAAVTHELRTPISVVKLYGEMLRDDWVQDEEKRQAYAERIVEESNRLSLLVDRVLEKRRKGGRPTTLSASDLNAEIRAQAEILDLLEAEDLRFDLQADLPPVLLTTEGVHMVLSNLVENARKYGVGPDGTVKDIVVRTLVGKRSQVWLEVADRGQGVPLSERERIFEAFYRIGDEATRSKPGTGLGLSLVAQAMRSQKGSIRILDRPGGGSVFRAIFKSA